MTARLGILASGGGTTANYLATEITGGNVDGVKIACCISSRNSDEAAVVGKMGKFGIPVEVVRVKDFPNAPMCFGQRILEVLKEHDVTHVLQNGWLPHTPPNVVAAYEGRIFNQHTGPTPEFGGQHMIGPVVHDAVLRFRNKIQNHVGRPFSHSVVVAHRVIEKYDEGAVVKSAYVPIIAEDTPDKLQERALPLEWRVQLDLVRDIARDCVIEESHLWLVLSGEDNLLAQAKEEAIAAAKQH